MRVPAPRAGVQSDAARLIAARNGDDDAFAELWSRHRQAGLTAARSMTSRLDPEDLVSEAYMRILSQVRNGGGPRTVFRPYLYQVIRSISMSGGSTEVFPSDELDLLADEAPEAPWDDSRYNHSATISAFSHLPERWQEVLWYCEVEGMPPRKVAELLGDTPNNISALLMRAKKGLRSAWIEAHLEQAVSGPECTKIRPQLQRFTADSLRPGASSKVEAHLAQCADCRAAQREMKYLTSGLGLTLATAFLGPSAEFLLAALNPAVVVAVGGAALATPIAAAVVVAGAFFATAAAPPPIHEVLRDEGSTTTASQGQGSATGVNFDSASTGGSSSSAAPEAPDAENETPATPPPVTLPSWQTQPPFQTLPQWNPEPPRTTLPGVNVDPPSAPAAPAAPDQSHPPTTPPEAAPLPPSFLPDDELPSGMPPANP